MISFDIAAGYRHLIIHPDLQTFFLPLCREMLPVYRITFWMGAVSILVYKADEPDDRKNTSNGLFSSRVHRRRALSASEIGLLRKTRMFLGVDKETESFGRFRHGKTPGKGILGVRYTCDRESWFHNRYRKDDHIRTETKQRNLIRIETSLMREAGLGEGGSQYAR